VDLHDAPVIYMLLGILRLELWHSISIQGIYIGPFIPFLPVEYTETYIKLPKSSEMLF